MEFPFKDAPNTAAITCCHIIEENEPILYVSHDKEDDMWQCLCGKYHNDSEARVASIYSLFSKDHSIAELTDMPCGFYAERKDKESGWTISKS